MPIKKLKEQLTLLMGKYKTIIHLEKKRGVNLSFVTKDHHKDFHFNFLCRMWIIQELANLNCNGPDSRYSRLCNQEAKLRRLCRYLYNHLKYNLKFLKKKNPSQLTYHTKTGGNLNLFFSHANPRYKLSGSKTSKSTSLI